MTRRAIRARRRLPVAGPLAWLPAALVLAIPAWLVLRATSGDADALAGLASADNLALLGRTTGFAALVVLGASILGLSTAFLTARTDLPGRRTFAVLLALPLAIPSYIGAFAFIAVFARGGLLDDGGGAAWEGLYSTGGAAIVLALLAFPYVFLPARAALLGVDPRLEESARVLGRSQWQTLRSVTFPLVRPAVVGGALMVALYSLSDFGAVSMLRVDTFTRVIYTQYSAFNREGAAALGLVLVVLTALLVGAVWATARSRARYTSETGPGPARRVPFALRRWRWPAFAWCALVALVSLGVPIAATLWFVLRGGPGCPTCEPLLELGANSLVAGSLTGAAAMLLAFPVVYFAVFGRARTRALPDRVLYGGFALPGIVVALAFVFFAHRVPALYQTLPLLVLALVLRFIPQAADALRPSLAQISPRLHEAARTLGATRFATVRRVTIPLALTGWLAGGALVFLTTVKELPATLLLRPTGFDTLAVELWDLTNNGQLSAAAARALALLAVAVLPMIVLVAREARRP